MGRTSQRTNVWYHQTGEFKYSDTMKEVINENIDKEIVPYIYESDAIQFFGRLCSIEFNGSWYDMAKAVEGYAFSSIPFIIPEEDEDCHEHCDVVDDLKDDIHDLEVRLGKVENQRDSTKDKLKEVKEVNKTVVKNYNKIYKAYGNLKKNSIIFALEDED